MILDFAVPKIYKPILCSSFSFFLCCGLWLHLLCGCSSLEPVEEYRPYENFLSITSDLQRHLADDVYQFPIAKDPSGQNIFKATLIRLDNYEKLYPEKFVEIIAYSRGKCHQKLGNFEEALFFFQQTIRYEGKLLPLATKDAQWTQSIIHIFKLPVPKNDLTSIVAQFDRRETLLKKLLEESTEDVDQSLLWRELERNLITKVEFIRQNRFHLPEGTKQILVLYQQMIREHKDSQNVYRHLLSLGDFYVLLAKEYLAYHPPESFAFKKEEFSQFTQPAMEIYRMVSNVDGRLEKIEAQGSLVALSALLEKYKKEAY